MLMAVTTRDKIRLIDVPKQDDIIGKLTQSIINNWKQGLQLVEEDKEVYHIYYPYQINLFGSSILHRHHLVVLSKS